MNPGPPSPVHTLLAFVNALSPNARPAQLYERALPVLQTLLQIDGTGVLQCGPNGCRLIATSGAVPDLSPALWRVLGDHLAGTTDLWQCADLGAAPVAVLTTLQAAAGLRALLSRRLPAADEYPTVLLAWQYRQRDFSTDDTAGFELIGRLLVGALQAHRSRYALITPPPGGSGFPIQEPTPVYASEAASRPGAAADNGVPLPSLVSAFANSDDGVVLLDATEQVLAVNPAFSRITGYRPDDVLGRPFHLLNGDPLGRNPPLPVWAELRQHGHWQGSLWCRRQSGEIHPLRLAIHAIRNQRGDLTHYLGLLTDITEQTLNEQRIHYLAHHDPLTGLPNRLVLQQRCSQALAWAARYGGFMALLFIELERLQSINQSLGRNCGDVLLKTVAERLAGCIQPDDLLCRVGGDDFVILLPHIHRPQDAAAVADRLIDSLTADPIRLYPQEPPIVLNIGISLYPQDGAEMQELLRNADIALFNAREKGRNLYRFYTPETNIRVFERLTLQNSLQRALERGELFLNYQPQVEMRSGRLVGTEALLRWRHPERGLIAPTHFIPVAEEVGLMASIGEWVLRQACAAGRRWHDAGYRDLRLAVNLEADQLRRGHPALLIRQVLDDTGFPATHLELELTEPALIQQSDETGCRLRACAALGVTLAVDDFGIGDADLNYLHRFPIRRLKIERAFVQRSTTHPEAAAFVSTIITLAHRLGMETVAVGVENRQQSAFLRAGHCDILQGYLLSPPLDEAAFTEFLRNQAH